MIEVKVKNPNVEVTLAPEKDLIIQEEIVQMIVCTLMAFRDRVGRDGESAEDADKDADIILNKAAQIYRLEAAKTKPSSETATPTDPIVNILQQVDDMLNDKNQKRYLS